ncbi:phosphoribosyltransferase family protein [Streptomyces olivochromogenes]|uniref:phosphoribosyltransferase family protein n=1 Tax=Streptomyces olivochromogenes TaxID=1963 RepID=UPI0036DB4EEB
MHYVDQAEEPECVASAVDAARQEAAQLLRKYMVTVPDFPIPGIEYIDFYRSTDRHPELRLAVMRCLEQRYRGMEIDAVAAIGGGGFGFGMSLANSLVLPFHSIRKAGETVHDALTTSVGMNYARRELTLATDVVSRGSRVVLVDDTLASGGSALGAIELLQAAGAEVVELAVLFEIGSKDGRQALRPVPVFSLLDSDNVADGKDTHAAAHHQAT